MVMHGTAHFLVRASVALVGLGFVGFACMGGAAMAGGMVHKQAGNTHVVRQSGGGSKSSTIVERTRDCQKVVTRLGRNTDVSVQCSGHDRPVPDRPASDRRSRRGKPGQHVDCRFGPGVCDETGEPVADRFEQRIKDRMR